MRRVAWPVLCVAVSTSTHEVVEPALMLIYPNMRGLGVCHQLVDFVYAMISATSCVAVSVTTAAVV